MRELDPSNLSLFDSIDITARQLKELGRMQWDDANPPEAAIFLGSGLGGLVDKLEGEATWRPFSSLHHFPFSNVAGHESMVWLGTLGGKRVLLQQGRGHCYEGNPIDRVVHPVRSCLMWGIKTLVVTNAAGGVNPNYWPGDLMILESHNNMLSGVNPLLGPNDERIGPRFPPMAGAYSRKLANLLRSARDDLPTSELRESITFRHGVYAMVPGPNYETEAETQMLRALGVDAVGMSTIPEVIAARHAGCKNILGLSLITNVAGKPDTDHAHVKAQGEKSAEAFQALMVEFMRQLGPQHLYE